MNKYEIISSIIVIIIISTLLTVLNKVSSENDILENIIEQKDQKIEELSSIILNDSSVNYNLTSIIDSLSAIKQKRIYTSATKYVYKESTLSDDEVSERIRQYLLTHTGKSQ